MPLLYRFWIGSTVLAAIVAVCAATVLNAETALVILLIAALEGCCLGALQHNVLRRIRPGFERGWFAATVAGMLLARGIQFVLDSSPLLPGSYAWPDEAQLAGALGAGALLGALMAAPQLLALRVPAAQRVLWLGARSAGGAVSFVILLAGQRALGAPPADFLTTFAILLALFAVAAAAGGTIEALAMERLIGRSRTALRAHPAR